MTKFQRCLEVFEVCQRKRQLPDASWYPTLLSSHMSINEHSRNSWFHRRNGKPGKDRIEHEGKAKHTFNPGSCKTSPCQSGSHCLGSGTSKLTAASESPFVVNHNTAVANTTATHVKATVPWLSDTQSNASSIFRCATDFLEDLEYRRLFLKARGRGWISRRKEMSVREIALFLEPFWDEDTINERDAKVGD